MKYKINKHTSTNEVLNAIEHIGNSEKLFDPDKSLLELNPNRSYVLGKPAKVTIRLVAFITLLLVVLYSAQLINIALRDGGPEGFLMRVVQNGTTLFLDKGAGSHVRNGLWQADDFISNINTMILRLRDWGHLWLENIRNIFMNASGSMQHSMQGGIEETLHRISTHFMKVVESLKTLEVNIYGSIVL